MSRCVVIERDHDQTEKKKFDQHNIPVQYDLGSKKGKIKIYLRDLKKKLPTLKKNDPISLSHHELKFYKSNGDYDPSGSSDSYVITYFNELHKNEHMILVLGNRHVARFSNVIAGQDTIDMTFRLHHNRDMFDNKDGACKKIKNSLELLRKMMPEELISEKELVEKNRGLTEIIPRSRDLELCDLQFYNKQLTGKQSTSVLNIIRAQNRPYAYILFGPPGTGKTVTLVEAILQAYKLTPKGSRILVCGNSNCCADLLTSRLVATGVIEDKQIIRLIGNGRHETNSVPADIKDISHETLKWPSKIIVTTCSKAASLKWVKDPTSSDKELSSSILESSLSELMAKMSLAGKSASVNFTDDEDDSDIGYHDPDEESTCLPPDTMTEIISDRKEEKRGIEFDYVFIDEAGHAQEADVAIPVTLMKPDASLVLAGDHHQLSPVTKAQNAEPLTVSILDRYHKLPLYQKKRSEITGIMGGYDERYITKLVNNYRSDAQVISVNNKLFYDNELVCSHKTPEELLRVFKTTKPIMFDDTSGYEESAGESSFMNTRQARQCLSYVRLLYANGYKPEDVGIITGYRGQVTHLLALFEEREVPLCKIASIDEFQGEEKKVIIISTVRTRSLGFMKDYKRFNVAVSRAQSIVIVIGDRSNLIRDVNWRAYVEKAEQITLGFEN